MQTGKQTDMVKEVSELFKFVLERTRNAIGQFCNPRVYSEVHIIFPLCKNPHVSTHTHTHTQPRLSDSHL